MVRNIKCGLLLFFCILLSAGYCFAKDPDISINDIFFPAKIYVKEKTTIYVYLKNDSGADLENCTLTIEAGDGSKISQTFALSKDGLRAEIKWVPQRQGKIEFKATLSPPKTIKDSGAKDKQVIETIEVLAKGVAGK